MTVPFGISNTAGVNFNEVYVAPSAGSELYGTPPPFNLGQIVWGADGTAWVWVKYGTGGATASFACTIDEDWLAVMVTTTNAAFGDKIGICPATALVDNYGWLQIFGVCDQLQVLASCAANVQLAATATAGALDDAVGTGTKNIVGVALTTARAASQGVAPATLTWPTVGTTNP